MDSDEAYKKRLEVEDLEKELAIKNKALLLMAEDLKSVVVTENGGKVEYILEHYIERASEEL